MKTIALIILFLFATTHLSAREWTAQSGHKITGEFNKLEGEVVHISLSNGKTAEIKLEQLCEADQEFVREQHEQKQSPFIIRNNNATPSTKEEANAGRNFDHNTPLDVLLAEAEKGDPDAMCWLSIFYARGLNVCKIDAKKSAVWCAKASALADSGNAAAQFCRGMHIAAGDGDEVKKQAEAELWFRRSADQGFAPAQASLGFSLNTRKKETGQGADGMGLLHKAADQNYAPAFVFLAMADESPEKWFRKAADAGDVAALIFCGSVYYAQGNEQEKLEAEGWIQKAAELGCVELPEMLGDVYREGKNVEPDMAEARKWYGLAAKHGSQKAKDILDDESNFTPKKPQPSETSTLDKGVEMKNGGEETPVSPMKQPTAIKIKVGDCSDCSFSPDSRYVSTTVMDDEGGAKTVSTIWATETGKKVFELPGYSVTFSPDGQYAASIFQSWDGNTRKYRDRERKWRAQNRGPRNVVPGSFTWVKVFDAKTGRELYEREIEECSIAFSEEGNLMFDGSLWQTENGRRLRKLSTDELKALESNWSTFNPDTTVEHPSPDDKLVCVEEKNEKRLLLQEKKSGNSLFKLENAEKPLWSPDGRFLLHRTPADNFGNFDTIMIYDLQKNAHE